MERERRILQKVLPASWYARIDVERSSIRSFVEEAAREIAEGAVIIDAGAGESPYRGLFVNRHYVAIDFGAGERSWDYGNLDLIAELCHLPLQTGCADAVLCTQVLEHVPEPTALLRELHRVLRPGGRLYLTAPQAFGEHQEPFDYFRYTSFGLAYIARKAEFRICRIRPRTGFFRFFAVMCMYLYERIFPASSRFWWRALRLPLTMIGAVLLLVIGPLILYPLDRFDRRRDITLGYAAVFEKSDRTQSAGGAHRKEARGN